MQKKQKIIVFSVIFLLLLFTVTIIIFMLSKKPPVDKVEVPEVAQIDKEVEEGSVYYETRKKARKEKNTEYCYELKSGDSDGCIYEAASYNKMEELCDEIKDEAIKKECHEHFLFQEIILSKTAKDCQPLSVDKFRQPCLIGFFWQWTDIKKCAEFKKEDKSLCEDIINKKVAYENNDIKLCSSIKSNALSADCKKVIEAKPKDTDGDGLLDSEELSYSTDVFKTDTDGDGLNDLEEMSKYFTNPKNPDTDDDGHKDGEEIKNGFNPNGPGKLEASKE